ncbi:MAG: hypothetical protein A3E87_00240 [Gammaproteobacteria bacterium RIFCSPHIGHO2_12_FULL_35_23]|nr:MAG: hypothetical protein A3E87_00240 [Gammaproteobacteria bacterium RIFCSPHIGHO2_12_FULL_35_23]
MKDLFNKLKDRLYYSAESIKNRYPCRIIRIKNELVMNKTTHIIYQAVTKLNLRELALKELVNDPLLIEKFHPTDCIKLGFLSAGELLIKNATNLEEARENYRRIIKDMFTDLKDDKYDS